MGRAILQSGPEKISELSPSKLRPHEPVEALEEVAGNFGDTEDSVGISWPISDNKNTWQIRARVCANHRAWERFS